MSVAMTTARTSTVFLAWTSRTGRARDVAAALGGEAVCVFPRVPGPHRLATALRYLLSVPLTVVALVRRRPSVVVVTNPPVVPVLVVIAYGVLTGARVVMDSHPSAFGAKGRRWVARLQGLHAWAARRCAAVLVTTAERARQVDAWGGAGLVLHEAPARFPEPRRPRRPTVLFAGVFATDEPVAEVVEAARRLPHVTFALTGDPAAAPPGLLDDAPRNVRPLGYLDLEAYADAVAAASVVLTLTTEPSSVMRSAYEAVYARVPLVTTDTPALRSAFPYAVHCGTTAESIAAGVARALDDLDLLVARADDAAAVQHARWEQQLADLRAVCGLP